MRKGYFISLIILLLLAAAIIFGLWQIKRVLSDAHIEQLDYRLKSLSLQHIQLTELSFVYRAEKYQHTIQLKNVEVAWQWQKLSPRLTTITADSLLVSGSATQHPGQNQARTSEPFKLPQEWRIPENLPRQIHISSVVINQPCPSGSCSFAGTVEVVSKNDQTADAVIKFSPGNHLDIYHHIELAAVYALENKLPKIDAKLSIDKRESLQIHTYLQQQTLHQQQEELQWVGHIRGSLIYLDKWWLDYLQLWNIKIAPQKNELATLALQSEWQLALSPLLNLPADADVAQWKSALTGRWQLDADLPSAIGFFDVGEFSGKARFDLAVTKGKPDRYALSADINAEHLGIPSEWQAMGFQMDSVHVNLQSKVDTTVNLSVLPLTFSGAIKGLSQATFSGEIRLDTATKKIQLDAATLAVKTKQLKPYADYELNNVSLELHAQGYWQPDSMALTLTAPGYIAADINAKAISVNAKALRIAAKQLELSGDIKQGVIVWPALRINADLVLKTASLSHPQLNPSPLTWQFESKGNLENLDVKGNLSVGSALTLQHQAQLKSTELNVDWTLPDIFLLAENPFAKTLKAWPPLLTLARGKLNAAGNLTVDFNKGKLLKSKTNVHLQDIAGIYDTIAFEGVNSKLNFLTTANTIAVSTNDITVNQINKGLIFGPVVAAGNYQASWATPLKGKLNLLKLESVAMGGTLAIASQQFDFSRENQEFILSLSRINLATLLQQHSPGELSGSGQLSGKVPVELRGKAIRVTKGLVSAEPPGGQLKYHSERAAALAKSQPGMKLITEALDDFHYSILASEVNYDESGKLVLSVRLEGKNPGLEKGRPINFNINLEEDVPAMLASMQLSSKVNDVIKNRLQEYLQKKSGKKTVP